MHLRHGVQFHNGRELAADDVADTFRSFLDPTFRGRSGGCRNVTSVDVVDRYTVACHLKEPFASFPVPYISLWYKTNIAVFQPDIHGVRLSPIADFTFLKDVYRSAPGAATH